MLYIYCAGSLASQVKDIALRQNYKDSDIIFVDDINKYTSFEKEIKTINFDNLCSLYRDKDSIVIANGEPSVRSKIYRKLKEKSFKLGILIDKTSIISPKSKIEEGAIVFPFSTVSYNTHVKENVLINNHSIIGHDVVLGKNSVISSMVNIGGNTVIGCDTYIGMGASIRERLLISDNCIISMGSSVFSDIKRDLIVVGNPGRVVRRNEEKIVFKK